MPLGIVCSCCNADWRKSCATLVRRWISESLSFASSEGERIDSSSVIK